MAEWTEEEKKAALEALTLLTRALDESMRADSAINLAAASGTNDLVFEQVKPGRVLIVEYLSAWDDTSGATRIRLGYRHMATDYWVKTVPAPLTTESVNLDSPLRLREGMAPIARIEGATSGDDIYANLIGYWIVARKG